MVFGLSLEGPLNGRRVVRERREITNGNGRRQESGGTGKGTGSLEGGGACDGRIAHGVRLRSGSAGESFPLEQEKSS